MIEEAIKKILMDEEVNRLVNERIKEFIENRFGDEGKWLIELSYCILTANTSAKSSLKCIEALIKDNIIFHGSLNEIEDILRRNRYRYPRKRAEYIVEARSKIREVKIKVNEIKDDFERRDWLRKNVRGLGMKESSHFLRNVGYFNYSIIDRHVLNVLSRYNIVNVNEVKRLNVKMYLEIEDTIRKISEKVGLKPGILDLYIWYMDTGEILK